MFLNYINISFHATSLYNVSTGYKILEVCRAKSIGFARNPQSRYMFIKNDGEIHVVPILCYIREKKIYIHFYIYKIYKIRRLEDVSRGGLSPRLLTLSSSVPSPFSFSPRPTSDLGE